MLARFVAEKNGHKCAVYPATTEPNGGGDITDIVFWCQSCDDLQSWPVEGRHEWTEATKQAFEYGNTHMGESNE